LFTAPIEASRPMVSNANNALAALDHRHLRVLDRGRLGLGASGIDAVDGSSNGEMARMAWAMMTRGERYKEPVALAA
jgi:hypothetical protein